MKINMNRRGSLTGAGALVASAACGKVTAEEGAKGAGMFSITALNPDCMVGGAGLCVVIRTPAGKTYLFDAGNGDVTPSGGLAYFAVFLKVTEIRAAAQSRFHLTDEQIAALSCGFCDFRA